LGSSTWPLAVGCLERPAKLRRGAEHAGEVLVAGEAPQVHGGGGELAREQFLGEIHLPAKSTLVAYHASVALMGDQPVR